MTEPTQPPAPEGARESAAATEETTKSRALLEARNVSLRYPVAWNWLGRPTAWMTALDDISLFVERGETLGILGRDGCGKSCLGRVLAGYEPPGGGEVLHDLDETDQTRPEPGPVQLIHSNPRSAVSPAMPVWQAITEPVALLEGGSPKALRAWAAELLYLVGLESEIMSLPARDLSPGELQRLAVGRALSLDSQCLILDDPTRDLPVLEQAGILNVLLELQCQYRLGYILLSRSPSTLKHMADRIVIMDGDQAVEAGSADQIMATPKHPFTRLWQAIDPNLPTDFDPRAATFLSAGHELGKGQHEGCAFAGQCPWRNETCGEPQKLREMAGESKHLIRCHRASAGEDMPLPY